MYDQVAEKDLKTVWLNLFITMWKFTIDVPPGRVAALLVVAAAMVGPLPDSGTADELDQARKAAQKALTFEAETHEQWFSVSSARAATQAIAEASREAAGRALAEFEAAETKSRLAERLTALRAAADQMITDHEVAQRAIEAVPPMETRMWQVIADTQVALRNVAQLEAKQAQALADGAVEDTAVSAAEQARVAWRKVRQIDALTAWKAEAWSRTFQQSTFNQMRRMHAEAGKLAEALAAVETDPRRQQRLKALVANSTEKQSKAQEQSLALGRTAEAAADELRKLQNLVWGGLKPLTKQKWDPSKAWHLLVRAGFGGTPKQVAELHAMGLHRAVESLVDFQRKPAAKPVFDAAPPQPRQPYETMIRLDRLRLRAANRRKRSEEQQLARLRHWWLRRLIESPRPLQEKMTLLWHGHFAVQQSVVENSYALYRQNQLFREHAAGNFGTLLYGIVHDPAMLRYLDNNTNVKGHANENLAREIMELFAVGEYQGYGEQDVREAARALTGYTFDVRSGQFRFQHAQHDEEMKTVFGRTGAFTGDDLVTLILDQPATSRFIARKLFEFFAYQDPDTETIEALATVVRDADYELAPVLTNLFLSEAFYSDKAVGMQVKSPVDLVVGTLRSLGVAQVSNPAAIDTALQEMGQELFEPPDVKGWRGGRSWINSSRLLARYNTVTELVRNVNQGGQKKKGVDVVALLQGAACETSADVVDSLAKLCLPRPLEASKRQELIDYTKDLPPVSQWTSQRETINVRLQDLLVLLTSMPEYQFQ
ncbi:MAG: hypothetical protein CMJ84_01295 [Planctomycetes bacterium]|nr:hypothetical protein [Planctomycetota bacterium]